MKYRRLLDHLVGKCDQLIRHDQTERLGGLDIDHQLEFRGELHRQVGALLALEDAFGISCRRSKPAREVGTVGRRPPSAIAARNVWIAGTCRRETQLDANNLLECRRAPSLPMVQSIIQGEKPAHGSSI